MPHAPLQLFCRFCYRNFPSDRSRRRHESATHNSDVDANKLKNSAPESHLFRRCNLCRIYTSSTEEAVTSHAGSEHHKRAVLALNLRSSKAGSPVGASSSPDQLTHPPVAREISEASVEPPCAGVTEVGASYGWRDAIAAGKDAAMAEADSATSASESASAENDLFQVEDVTSSYHGADGQSGGKLCVQSIYPVMVSFVYRSDI